MRPKKHLIEQAQANGSMDRLNLLLSASHILLCEANSLIGEASDLMSAQGLLIGMIKKKHGDLLRVSDAYFKEFASLITTEQSKMDMFGDMDDFDNKFRAWAKVPVGWKPKEIEK